jgi:hypothetical protein
MAVVIETVAAAVALRLRGERAPELIKAMVGG